VCGLETSTIRRLWDVAPQRKKIYNYISNIFREISVSKCYHKITGVHNVIAKAVSKYGSDV
jgi:hypothetical protein